jgi:ribonuclease III
MGAEEKLGDLARALGHEFRDLGLLKDALTHRSLTNERPRIAPRDNERLEFLGDAVIGLSASALLYESYPEASEGELTRRRADLVCEAGLAAIARELPLAEAMRLGRGEELSGGRDKPRLLASALEACLAAVYLDAGLDAAMTVARRLLFPRLEVREQPGAHDFKSRIQEIVQARGGPTPTYELRATEGPDHDRTFHVAVWVADEELGVGSGRSKVEAEQAAAEQALARLDERA